MANAGFKESAPLMEQIVYYDKEADLLNDLENRVVKRKKCPKVPYISYDFEQDVYPITIEFEGEEKKKYPAPSFAVNHITSGFLKVGDNIDMIQSCVAIDKLLNPYGVQIVDGQEVKVKVDRHDNIERYNQILSDVWKYRRTENTRVKPIVAHLVFDRFTPNGSIRAFTGEGYGHISDYDIWTKKVKPNLEAMNIELDYVKGYSTALMTQMDYIRKTPNLSSNDVTVTGLTIINSEFKYSSIQIGSYIYMPSLKIGVVGTTRNVMGKIPHIGGQELVDKRIKYVVNQVLGNTDAFNARFKRLNTEQWLELNDFEDWDLRKSLNISQEKMDKLIEIIDEEGYPHTVAGIVYGELKYAQNHAQTFGEMERFNNSAQEIINDPEKFQENILPKETPEDWIELDDGSERPAPRSPRTKKVIPTEELEEL